MQSDIKSKTQLKKEAAALQALGRELTNLAPSQLGRMDLPEELHQAVLFFQASKKHGARRRQLQYIGTLMRDIDPEPVYRQLDAIAQAKRQDRQLVQKIAGWRDALASGESDLLEKLPVRYPHTDRQRLHQLVRNARKEVRRNKAGKATRVLFEYLKSLVRVDPV